MTTESRAGETMDSPPGTTHHVRPDAPPSRLVVLGLLLGIVLATLDGTVVGTALPTIVGDLGGLGHLSWVITAYLLTAAVSTPIWGKLGDLYGHKGSYLTSITVFLIGSVLCGLAQDMGQLIAFRALQGIGAGGLFVGALALIGTLLTPAEAGRAQSMIGVLLPAAMIGGPLVGGLLTDQLDWRWVFYVNVPVGAVALALIGFGVRLRAARVKARIDLAGAGLLTGAILALTLLMRLGQDDVRLVLTADPRARPGLRGRAGRLRTGRAARPGTGDPAPAVPRPQLLGGAGAQLRHGRGHAGGGELSAPVPAVRAGHVVHRERTAAAPADAGHDGGPARHRPHGSATAGATAATPSRAVRWPRRGRWPC